MLDSVTSATDPETLCNCFQMEVAKSHGCICLTGLAIERITAEALSFLHMPATVTAFETAQQQISVELDSCMNEYRPHVTLVTKEELAACTVSRSDLLQEFQRLDSAAFFPVGIAIVHAADGAYTGTTTSLQSVMKTSTHLNFSTRGQEGPMLASTISHMQPFAGKSSK